MGSCLFVQVFLHIDLKTDMTTSCEKRPNIEIASCLDVGKTWSKAKNIKKDMKHGMATAMNPLKLPYSLSKRLREAY